VLEPTGESMLEWRFPFGIFIIKNIRSFVRKEVFKMQVVGYFAGTDPLILTKLASEGIGVLPLGNGYDNHGKYIGHITKEENIGAVIGYIHKVLTIPGGSLGPKDILFSCKTYRIPIVLMASEDDIKGSIEQLGEAKEYVTVVTPEKAYDTIKQKMT
jgi:hypothetical protein